MVRYASQTFLLAALFTLSVSAAEPDPVPDYRLGDTAKEDLVTPVPLMIVDAEATEALRQQELARIPLIYRFDTRAADGAEAAFHAAYTGTRERYLSALEKSLGARKVNDAAISTVAFQDVCAGFAKGDEGFPASPRLMIAWARGESDETYEGSLTGRLRDAMGRYIRTEGLPPGVKTSARARVVPAVGNEALTLEKADRQHEDVARGNMPILAKARADLIASFSADEQTAATFLANFMKENCSFEPELTRAFRARQTEALLSAVNYQPGQLVLRRGQPITTKTKAALDQMREKLRGNVSQRDLVEREAQTRIFIERNRWLLIALVTVVVLFAFVIWRITSLRRRVNVSVPVRVNNSNLPMKVIAAENDGMVISCPTCKEHIAVPFDGADSASVHDCDNGMATPDQWKQRALAAERRAEQAAAMVRAGLLDQIAQNLTGEMVKQLIEQRDQLAMTQHQAANEVESLEGRLEKTEADWQAWRQSYEARIRGLEKELSESNEMNRALIRTKIAAAREQLASAEAAHKRTHWN